ncbi:D-alanyl-D-alanine carboxypeptidase [Luteolibacter sp. SL250]|uniref:D-alanyl-D-alanine carboxypeptidase family protein n=1 Tax=Luteolibacter sp. SL250 TaxID=2995170 RepID=UPI002271FD87|nr:D-alanyl-D-alanine carboxypeptidase family protein [Luteolibacter sp. SL250]WAC21815.1 D-alanyl-D-alanine carboxypeptidase [Luteolibacter sp. SL250]
MSRSLCVRFSALACFAAFVTSCGGNPPPPLKHRELAGTAARENAAAAPSPAPVRVGAIPLTPPPPVVGESAIVVDVESGRVLYAKNADQRRAVASTQKIITALCVLDAGNLDKVVTISASDGACEPTKLGLKAGETYTRRELLKVLMVKSANDVGRALARDVGGSQEAFAAMMNRKCAALGMRNSHFKNPHGLTEPDQFSTARDMAIAASVAYRSPIIRSFAATKAFTFRFNDGRTRLLENTNKVLKTLPYCDGMKTGTTNASGRCLISSGSLNGRSVIAVVLKSNTPNIWSDSSKLLRWSLERPQS